MVGGSRAVPWYRAPGPRARSGPAPAAAPASPLFILLPPPPMLHWISFCKQTSNVFTGSEHLNIEKGRKQPSLCLFCCRYDRRGSQQSHCGFPIGSFSHKQQTSDVFALFEHSNSYTADVSLYQQTNILPASDTHA